jgi:molybdopterin/thiamine biosynthesis adenylyltransferase
MLSRFREKRAELSTIGSNNKVGVGRGLLAGGMKTTLRHWDQAARVRGWLPRGRLKGMSMENLYQEIFSRNIGLFTESEQDKLRQSSIAIAGMGGIGGLLAERLIRLGVGQLKISDPEDFEPSNLNRQLCSSMANLGQNKAEVVYAHIKDINPQARIHYSKTGIKTENDANLLVSDCDLVIDEMTFGLLRESILLQRAAREKGIYYIFTSALGFGALVVIFDPEGLTLEEYNQLPPDIDLNTAELKVPIKRALPVKSSYVKNVPGNIIKEFISSKRLIPVTSIGAGLASLITANEAMNIILKKRDIVKAPQYTYIDLLDRQFTVGTVSQAEELGAIMNRLGK